MNIVKEWTRLDKTIFYIEEKFKSIKEFLSEPDAETMILAETEHLQQENAQLKKKQYPGALLIKGENYLCPDCKEIVDPVLIAEKKKYCPECGKRIVLLPIYH